MFIFGTIVILAMNMSANLHVNGQSMDDKEPTSPSQQFQVLTLGPELACRFVDPSFLKNKGVIVQFFNNNCPGSTSSIGGLRLAQDDIRKIPAYLEKYQSKIRLHAVKCLERHLKDNNCCIGAGEILAAEDYGTSFSLATLSPRAASLNPGKRNEGPLFYCLLEGMWDPIFVNYYADGSADTAHVINCYVYLLPAAQRRQAVLRKLQEEKAANNSPQQQMTTAAHPTYLGYGKRSRANGPSGAPFRPRLPGFDGNNEVLTRMERMEQQLKVALIPSPPLPETPAPSWSHDGVGELPDE